MTTTLYWLSRDLRLDDNPALLQAAQAQRLLCAYCVDAHEFRPHRYQTSSIGPHRWQFLQQALSDFNQSLLQLGQRLHIVYGETDEELSRLIHRHSVERLVCSRQFGTDEIRLLNRLQKRFPLLIVQQVDNYTLLQQQQLPFAGPLPTTFSGFRKAVEKLPFSEPLDAPKILPPPPPTLVQAISRPAWLPNPVATRCPFDGGESIALQHLDNYCCGALPHQYKRTRNQLDGRDNSSTMSPWLNSGCLSARRLQQRLSHCENLQGGDRSTGRLLLELLWREYFQWLALEIGPRLFAYRGMTGRPPLSSFHPERFAKWRQGNTPYALVNACMQQLKQTGYLSNRGRQIAASCLIHELQVDWRYGAAWFEHQLVDYDVATNWGNWQYIAGVGCNPRGARHVNIDRQTRLYDADGLYRQRWAADPPTLLPLDSVDAADWPISP